MLVLDLKRKGRDMPSSRHREFKYCSICEQHYSLKDVVEILPASNIYVCRDCSPAPFRQFRPGAKGRFKAVLKALYTIRTNVVPTGDWIDLDRAGLLLMNTDERNEFIDEIEQVADKLLEELQCIDTSEWALRYQAKRCAEIVKSRAQAARGAASDAKRFDDIKRAKAELDCAIGYAPPGIRRTFRVPDISIPPIEIELTGDTLLEVIDRCAEFRNTVLAGDIALEQTLEHILFFARVARQLQVKVNRDQLEQFAMHYFAKTVNLAIFKVIH